LFGHGLAVASVSRSSILGATPATQAPGQTLLRVDQAVLFQPRARIAGVLEEPPARAPETKTVAPRVHVLEHAHGTERRQAGREQHLQVAHGALLDVVATCVGVEAAAAPRAHARVVTGLVEDRVQ